MTQTVLLGDICDVRDGTHDSPKPKDSGHPLITSKHIKNHKIDFSSANLISDSDFEAVNKRSKVDKNDILISMIGTVGELAFIDYEPTFAIKNIGLIKTGDELMGRYLFYYLQSTKAKQYLEASLAGSTQKFIGLGLLRKFPIDLPEIGARRKIVDILGTIDEKIELNRKMNETLEQMGQALFRHYFITNPEAEKWGKTIVGEFADHLKTPVSPVKSPDMLFNQYSIPGYDNSYTPELSKGDTIKSGKYKVASKSILVSKLNPATPRIWAVLKPKENAICSTEFQVIAPKNYYAFCYFLLMSKEYTDKMAMSAGGTSNSHRRIKPADILNYSFAKPSDEALETFEQQIMPSLEVIEQNREQIQTITALRDTLLPRLINGKVKV